MKKTKELLEKDIKSLFWKYAIPSMTMMVIMSVYFIVDAIFIGRGVGSEALGAVNLTIPIMVIVNSITMSLAIGASIIISIYLSKKKYVKANNTFTNILLINAVISLVFTGLGLVFSSQIATLL
jgi:Na+-driven multidrug efflux pump